MDDQSPLIKSTSGKSGYYRSENSGKPSGASGSSKDFKKILNSEKEEDNSSGQETVESRSGKEEVDNEQILPFESSVHQEHAPAAHPKVASSPFALFGHGDEKMVTAKKSPLPEGRNTEIAAAENVTTETPPSLFALSSKKDLKPASLLLASRDKGAIKNAMLTDKNSVPTDPAEVEDVDTPAITTDPDFIKEQAEVATQKKTKSEMNNMALENMDKTRDLQYTKGTDSKEEKINSQFAREHTDLSYVNPLASVSQPTAIEPSQIQTDRPMPTVNANLQSLIEQLVKELSVVTQGGKTETSIVLNHPPQFDGVKIIITSYESSQKEFNLKFENLTQAGQQILDQQQNRADLIANLERKGYNVHIFVTTTYSETNPLATNTDATPREREEQKNEERQERNQDERDKRDNRQA